ncbi:endonuclease/exonuclease/phosphatase family protein [Nocardia uniformis]|uniref:Endonuclease/exonuclease/phosphatase family protein n=1 Tax=Nocardia uniformis TaxID=53432 RepID=A0A849BZW6_9NOCA|nr:endonuclease/exonuclease/phosphatase family protein [Nocardia uniformis]NNH69790.1 endonuclease/exonuclease/phosphatase family protein [Nocardia uniformis]
MINDLVRDQQVAEEITRPRRGLLGWLLLVSGWLLLLAGAIGVGLHYNSWVWEPAILVTSFASYLMVGTLIAIVLLGLARQWVSTALAVAVSATALWTQAPMLWPDGTAPAGTDLVVMQSNLFLGHGSPEGLVDAARDSGAEVLTLDELTPGLLDRLDAAGLADLLPHRYAAPSGGGQGSGIFSRYPLRDGIKFEGFWLNNLRATMIHPGLGPITVFALHPIPPLSNAEVWTRELGRIRELLDAESGRVVVGGDFNATYDHTAYRNLVSGRYADSTELLGVGAMPTWPTDRFWGPVIGIDRILVAGGHATAVHSLPITGTDHRAVVAHLRL